MRIFNKAGFNKKPFNKNKKIKINDKSAETIIGSSVKVEGSFIGEKNILVEGQITGNLKTSADLTVAEGAKIEADVEANNLLVSGKIIGNVKCHHKVELTASAQIIGDIETDIISVETGAIIKGCCSTNTNQEDRLENRKENTVSTKTDKKK